MPEKASVDGSQTTDDGLPNPPAKVTYMWLKVSGPGLVTFDSPTSAKTAAAFSMAGVYTIQLTASDGALSSSKQVVITVQAGDAYRAPVVDNLAVNAGPDQTISATRTVLSGVVTPTDSTVQVSWSLMSGSGKAAFANSNSLDTSVVFSQGGVYVLRLFAMNSPTGETASDEIRVQVAAGSFVGNDPPPQIQPGSDTVAQNGQPVKLVLSQQIAGGTNVTVYDVQGHVVDRFTVPVGSNVITWIPKNLPTGVYILQLD
ncbi:MAG: PKD domain-containing protein, partial [Candidatus Saccharimonadales bacterium]